MALYYVRRGCFSATALCYILCISVKDAAFRLHDFFFYLKESCLGKHSALLECNKFSGYDFFPADIYR